MNQASSYAYAYELIGQLYERRVQLTPGEIINELIRIRKIRGFVPGFPSGHKYNLAPYEIFQTVATSKQLTPANAADLVKVLTWNEYEAEQSYGNVLAAMERFPQRQFRKPLLNFATKMRFKMKSEGPGTHRYADFASYEDWAKRILFKC